MDLELVGKKLLEALAVQGRVASMQTKLLDLQQKVTAVEGEIQESQEVKASNLRFRQRAEVALRVSVASVKVTKQQVVQAGTRLKLASKGVAEAEGELAKYSDVVLGQLDENTQHLLVTKQAIEAERDNATKELGVVREDLENRQAELKTLGVELNLSSSPRPKTTYL